MKATKILFVLFFFGLTTLQTQAQGMLWEISGNGLSEPSYLFGTVDVKIKNAYKTVDSIVWSKFDASKKLVMDINPKSMNPQEMAKTMTQEDMQNIQKLMVMPLAYSAILPPEDYELLEKALDKYLGVILPNPNIDRLSPLFLAQAITEEVRFTSEKESMSTMFVKKAEKDEKPIGEWLTPKETFSILEKLTISDQNEILLKIIRDPKLKNTLKKENDNLVNAYIEQDDQKYYKFSTDDETDASKKLRIDETKMIAERLQAMLAEGSSFVILSASQIGGEDGLVNVLKSKGYTLTPIRYNGK